LTVDPAGSQTDTACVSILDECSATFEDGKFDDWDNLLKYESCVEDVECPNDVAGTDLRTSLQEKIESMKQNWGRDWDIINSVPRQLISVMALAAPVFAIVRYCYH
ncbi:unnamed protein product, partial [Candidula unifasciata]